MYPTSMSEKLMYSTVRLETDKGTGTGFFFNFEINNGFVPVIITNKHVINYNPNEKVVFKLHTGDREQKIIDEESIEVNFSTNWIFHETHDLCFCYINPLISEVKVKFNKDIFYMPLTESLIWDSKELENLNAIEEVIMVGYPKGLWNEKDNLPLFRKGITSSHPAIDFNKKGIATVDMACFPGSSGSPIFVLNENSYSDKNGETYLGRGRIILLGILFSGPTMNIDGQIILEPQQNVISRSNVMINLGYYVKANELNSFIDTIKKHVTFVF